MEQQTEHDWTVARTAPMGWWEATGRRARGYEKAPNLDQMLEVIAEEAQSRGIGRGDTVLVRGEAGDWTATTGELIDDVGGRHDDGPRPAWPSARY